MAAPFLNVRYLATRGQPATEGATRATGATRGAVPPRKNLGSFEAAARYYLEQHFAQDLRPAVRSLTTPDRPEVVPDLNLKRAQEMPKSNNTLVVFEQRRLSVPIFGSNAVVELDKKKQLISLDADIAEVGEVSAVPAIDQPRALGKIAEYCGVSRDEVQVDEPASLVFFHRDSTNTWHLAFHFRNVPHAPPLPRGSSVPPPPCHLAGSSLRDSFPRFDYLVDAHDGQVLFSYSAAPSCTPTQLKGYDELGTLQKFWGREEGGSFLFEDPVRNIKTYDLNQAAAGSDPPPNPIKVDESSLGQKFPAAVSAHANATKVYKFLNSVLNRKGIDGKGMELVSLINCTDPKSTSANPRRWSNAQWFNGRMWYGETQVNGKPQSYACKLDIIAHELTHGVTEFTANLIYDGQSGALNESFSDIFGVIINNWDAKGSKNVENWEWEIGKGLGKPGEDGSPRPLRDLKDPSRIEFFAKTEATKNVPNHYPARFADYFDPSKYGWGNWDGGGVHINSNIHNKAAYLVLTGQGADKAPLIDAEDVAVLYYHCLIRLSKLADFAKVKQVLLDVAAIYFSGDAQLELKLEHIRGAYKEVGL